MNNVNTFTTMNLEDLDILLRAFTASTNLCNACTGYLKTTGTTDPALIEPRDQLALLAVTARQANLAALIRLLDRMQQRIPAAERAHIDAELRGAIEHLLN